MYDYGTGKQNWLSSGLPTEGEGAGELRVGTLIRKDVPTCALGERLGDVATRAGDWHACVVVNEARVVLGLLRAEELQRDPGQLVDQAMRPGPSTFRPQVSALELARFMTEHDLVNTLITTGDGVLIGLLRREDVLRAAEESHREHDHDG